MTGRAVLLAAMGLLTNCAGPIAIAMPPMVDSLLPGRSLAQTAKEAPIGPAARGLTLSRLTREPDVATLEVEPGDLWPDPVSAVPTLDQVAAQVRAQEQSNTAPPATVDVQPRPPTP